ncbi:MAG: DUF2071 domain-containing protein [Planctomycetaceae bacterium]
MKNPPSKTAGYQTWRNLLFLHWRVTPERIQSLLPEGLTVDTFDGSAWLAVVPFSMERVRPWWSPAVPGISWFLETNVRTYVKHGNGQTGVWFFSLDANHRLAVTVARRFWHLNYVYSQMSLSFGADRLTYSGNRAFSEIGRYEITADIAPSKPLTTAAPGTLEHFLLERYHLFARQPNGRFLCGQVHHEPYQYQPIANANVTQTLTHAAQCPIAAEHAPDHMAWSPGVNVRVSPLFEVV